jgi:hypothetical protein
VGTLGQATVKRPEPADRLGQLIDQGPVQALLTSGRLSQTVAMPRCSISESLVGSSGNTGAAVKPPGPTVAAQFEDSAFGRQAGRF